MSRVGRSGRFGLVRSGRLQNQDLWSVLNYQSMELEGRAAKKERSLHQLLGVALLQLYYYNKTSPRVIRKGLRPALIRKLKWPIRSKDLKRSWVVEGGPI